MTHQWDVPIECPGIQLPSMTASVSAIEGFNTPLPASPYSRLQMNVKGLYPLSSKAPLTGSCVQPFHFLQRLQEMRIMQNERTR